MDIDLGDKKKTFHAGIENHLVMQKLLSFKEHQIKFDRTYG